MKVGGSQINHNLSSGYFIVKSLESCNGAQKTLLHSGIGKTDKMYAYPGDNVNLDIDGDSIDSYTFGCRYVHKHSREFFCKA